MLGIEEIGSYIPEGRVSNYSKKECFDITDTFLEEKIGVKEISVKDTSEDTSDLCIKAFNNLTEKTSIDKEKIDVLIVVTQNPDTNIPHCSAIVHGKLGIAVHCACFDISLGCSGYVYALSVIQSMMKEHGFKRGLLFTADPYSKIIDPNDKNTSLLFGDAATVSLITENPKFVTGKFIFGTIGKLYKELECKDNKLFMNGRAVFNFAAKMVPHDIRKLLKSNDLSSDDIDKFIFHQGSKIIVDTLAKRLDLPGEKVVFDIFNYGNTVSSSIPLLLQNEFKNNKDQLLVICGFGVGLSLASTVLRRVN